MATAHSIDPDSPVPLYHQIAQLIRSRIESGELPPGAALQPLRVAAEKWGVNLHTVRHAYASLAREGLVTIGRGSAGTRVAGVARGEPASRGALDEDLAAFLSRIETDAAARFGMALPELAMLLRERLDARARSQLDSVYVVECSEWQCTLHAREIMDAYAVDARPWRLEAEAPPGPLIATYFHYNDIRRLWPHRLTDAAFVTIRPDPMLRARLGGPGGSPGEVVVCEQDAETAAAVVGDLEALFGDAAVRFVPVVAASPERLLRDRRDRPVLFPPRIWAELPHEQRRDPRAVEIVYRFDRRELDAVAGLYGWPKRLDRAS